MNNECPFWAIQKMCNSNKCEICHCTVNEIPTFWRRQQEKSYDQMFNHLLKGSHQQCPESNNEIWCNEDEFDPGCVYVNLTKNQESYTAYEVTPVWKAIYEENCMIDRINTTDISNTCSEETLLYQLLSGLHASINMHVNTHFFNAKVEQSTANHKRYVKSLGAFEDRLKNLYFIYAVVVRAVNRLEYQLDSYDYQTGLDPEQDQITHTLVYNLISSISNSSCPFNEEKFFVQIDNAFEKELLLKEIQQKFFNVSRIIDCVSCEKCKLNGKLQIRGLGAAMKLLFVPKFNGQSRLQLERTEIIAIVNLLSKLSESIQFYHNFQKHEEEVERQIMIVKVIAVVLILAFTSFAKRMLTFKRKKVVAVGQSTAGKLADNKKNN